MNLVSKINILVFFFKHRHVTDSLMFRYRIILHLHQPSNFFLLDLVVCVILLLSESHKYINKLKFAILNIYLHFFSNE